MSVSPKAITLLKHFEGVKYTAYLCPAGVPTIGAGHTGPDVTRADVKNHKTITESEVNNLLSKDLAKFETAVRKAVKVSLNEDQIGALVSFAYNVGVGALQKSTLLKVINEGHLHLVRENFMKWTKGGGRVLPGLVRRRGAEADLFEHGTVNLA